VNWRRTPAPVGRGLQQAVLALQAEGAAADQLDVVVEGQRRQVAAAGGGLPGLHEPLGLGDLAGPVLRGPEPHAGLAAEVAVEVGADLVPVEPGQADLGHGVEHLLGRQEADVGGADRMPRRGVLHPLLDRQRVDTAEEEGH
jgi:hypothetical protein